MVSRRPDHSQSGKAILRDLEVVSRMMAAVLLRGPEDETKSGFENVKIACVQKLVEMLEGVVELAVGAVLDEKTREAQDAEDETLGERRKVVDLDRREFVVTADDF